MSRLRIDHIGRLLTMRLPTQDSGPLRGAQMREAEVLQDAGLYVEDGRIADIGPTADICAAHPTADDVLDAGGRMVTPGLVDPHTHLVHAGSREHELAQKLAGVPYLEILANGGGIHSTVRATRDASADALVEKAMHSLQVMNAHGVTTVEAKSGYGLDWANEEKQLRAVRTLAARQPVRLVSTFLGAHAVPPEFRGREDELIDLFISILPTIRREGLADFCDVFCETGVFTVDQSRRLLSAARQAGLGVKVHADEVEPLGGAEMAADVGAISADHLLAASDAGLAAMAASGTIAVVLPGTSWNLGASHARARAMIDTFGLPVAVATDYNPGSCPTENFQLVMAFACHLLKMTPMEVFVAATRNAACAVGRGERAGVIDVGRPADLVLWAADNPEYVVYHFGVNHADRVWVDGRLTAEGGRTRWR